MDKNPLVSSSALVAGMHLMSKSPEIVRRWYAKNRSYVLSGGGPWTLA